MLQWANTKIKENDCHTWKFPHPGDVYQSHQKVPGVVRNVQYMGGVIGFWQNYCYKQTERKAVGL